MSNRHVHGLFGKGKHLKPDEVAEVEVINNEELAIRLRRINVSTAQKAANLLDQILGGNEHTMRRQLGNFVVNGLLMVRSAVFAAVGRTPNGTPSPQPPADTAQHTSSPPPQTPPPVPATDGRMQERKDSPASAPTHAAAESATQKPPSAPTDHDVVEKSPQRKRRSATEILGILAQVDVARRGVRGAIGKVLYAHGIGSSHVRQWEQKRTALEEQAAKEATGGTALTTNEREKELQRDGGRKLRSFPEPFKKAVWTVYCYLDHCGQRGAKSVLSDVFGISFASAKRWQQDHQWPLMEHPQERTDGRGRRYPRALRQAVVTLYEHFDAFGKGGGKTQLLGILGISSSLPYTWQKTVGAFDGEDTAATSEHGDDAQSQLTALLTLEKVADHLEELRSLTLTSRLLAPHVAGLRQAIEHILTIHCSAHQLAPKQQPRGKRHPAIAQLTPAEALQEMDVCTRDLAAHIPRTSAPVLLLPLMEQVQSAIAEAMQLTGTPPKEEKPANAEAVDAAPPSPAPATVAMPPQEDAPIEQAPPAAETQPSSPPPTPSVVSTPAPSPAALPTEQVATLKVSQRPPQPEKPPSVPKARPAPRNTFVGFRRPERGTAYRQYDEEDLQLTRRIAAEDRREIARRKAFTNWAQDRFQISLATPAMQRRVPPVHPAQYTALAFEITRKHKYLALPVLRELRGSPIEARLRERGLSLKDICLRELPVALASFDPAAHRDTESGLKKHIRDHLFAHISEIL